MKIFPESTLALFVEDSKTVGVMDDAHPLPDDLAECHQLLLAAFKQASELERVLDATAASYAELKETHQAAIDELDRLKRWIYGRRRERINEGAGQQHLFDLQPPTTATTEESLQQQPRYQVTGHSRRRRRELDLDKLPHYRHELDVQPVEKICTCCGRVKDRIGEDETKILDYVPPKLEVHVHVRPKYACRWCKNGVVSPPPPQRPIARGIAGPGLIAQIVVSKFSDHLPLYRQEDFFTRHGLHIPRSTLCDWVQAAAELLRPLYQRQKELVLQSPVLWTDDTPVTMLTGGKDGSRQGRFWTYIGKEYPYSVYDFTESRARDGPAQFLAGFQGYLHADAYGGYDHIYLGSNESIREVACWAHARRKFFEATSSSPREAHQILDWIGQLYDIEDRARELSDSARQALRKGEAEPVLDRIAVYLAQLASRALPKSALGKAVSYAQNQWQALRRYTADGQLTIDNNISERTLRHQAIGRKNWLFLGSHQAGPRAAVLFTILAGAKRHRIEPWTYLRELLLRLHADDSRLDEMLPDRWAANHTESILTYRLEESRQKAARQRERRQHRRALR